MVSTIRSRIEELIAGRLAPVVEWFRNEQQRPKKLCVEESELDEMLFSDSSFEVRFSLLGGDEPPWAFEVQTVTLVFSSGFALGPFFLRVYTTERADYVEVLQWLTMLRDVNPQKWLDWLVPAFGVTETLAPAQILNELDQTRGTLERIATPYLEVLRESDAGGYARFLEKRLPVRFDEVYPGGTPTQKRFLIISPIHDLRGLRRNFKARVSQGSETKFAPSVDALASLRFDE